jgi:hypothetical protein
VQRHTRRYPEPAMMKAKTLTLLLALSTGCTAAKGVDSGFESGLVADFSLPDQNPTSARSGQAISPRDYLGDVSGWYFIHST